MDVSPYCSVTLLSVQLKCTFMCAVPVLTQSEDFYFDISEDKVKTELILK